MAQPLLTESAPSPVQTISTVFQPALSFCCAYLFADILSAIQEPGKEVEDGLVFAGNIGRDFQEQLKIAYESEEKSGGEGGREGCKSWRMNEKMVPMLTCYELAIKIMFERVEIMREDK